MQNGNFLSIARVIFVSALLSFLLIQEGIGGTQNKEVLPVNIRDIPKVELHAHLDGSVRIKTIMELSAASGRKRGGGAMDLKEWLQEIPEKNRYPALIEKLNYIIDLLKTEDALERVTYEFLEDSWKENIVYIEFRFAPAYHVSGDLSLERVVQAVISGKNRAEKKFPVKSGLILCFNGKDTREQQLRILQLAREYKDKGVVGVDFIGDIVEDYPKENFREIREFIKRHGLNLTAHAGEVSGPEGILKAVRDLGASRIGHGVRLCEDKRTYNLVRNRGIVLELCPTSNVKMGIVENYRNHPLPAYFRGGIKATLNTDDRTIFDTSLNREWAIGMEEMGLRPQELVQLNYNALEGAFIDNKLKEELKKQIQAGVERAFH